jgi:catechol 2,3-dioxygenase-like lactoylglutathione lyase family enzyme
MPGMKIEHTAYQVADAARVARWYAEHLGMTIKRSMDTSPFAHFVADSGDTVMLEFYSNPAVETPNYYELHPLVFHLAFYADDVAGTRDRLLAAGATPEGEIGRTPGGDEMCLLRDPWGLPLQLVNRQVPMI